MKMRNFKRKRLNNKGFTLIELLAVIVILAVVMLVATTSVLSAMNNSRQKSLENSASSAANAFTTGFSESVLTGETTIYNISGLMAGTESSNAVVSLSGVDTKGLHINSTDYDLAKSYAIYDGKQVVICFTATENRQFYVAGAVSTAPVTKGTGNTITLASGTMWACSDGSNSWT